MHRDELTWLPSVSPTTRMHAHVASSVVVSVCTPAQSAGQRDYAVNVTLRALPFLENYFQIPYPLAQLILAGIPDFSAGAMVRWAGKGEEGARKGLGRATGVSAKAGAGFGCRIVASLWVGMRETPDRHKHALCERQRAGCHPHGLCFPSRRLLRVVSGAQTGP